MLMGHADGLPQFGSLKELLLSDPVSELDADEEADISKQILYIASFEELAAKNVSYDTIIWVSISLLLVLAWGVGIFMLLYLPMRRYVLQKDLLSRKLYVTPDEVVYKVSRPSFIPFWGIAKIEKHVPLQLVIDIIIEQGCLQSAYGIHTLRIESIAQGKDASVDELQVQGVSSPEILRKVIVKEAAKAIQSVGRNWKTTVHSIEGENMAHMGSFTEGPAALRSPSRNWKQMALREREDSLLGKPLELLPCACMMIGSPRHAPADNRGAIRTDILVNKIDEVNKSMKKIEVLIEKSQATRERS